MLKLMDPSHSEKPNCPLIRQAAFGSSRLVSWGLIQYKDDILPV